jgi:uncharacterized protein (UPF0333 family)
MKRRGQISIEYLMVIGFSLFMISVLLVLFSQHNATQSTQITDSQLNQIGNKIISAVEEIYYLGEPSRKKITIYMPSGVENISISGHELLFIVNIGGEISDLEFYSKIPIQGNISTTEGVKNIRIIAQSSRVCIIQEGNEECTT